MIRLGPAPDAGKRSRGAAACPGHRGRRRPRCRSAAGRPGRRQRVCTLRPTVVRGSTPRRRRHRRRGHVDIRPAVVAVEHRSVRQPGDRPRRRGRRRTERSRSRRGFRTYRDRASTTPRRPSRRSSRPQPANELRDRFPGHQIGTIGAAALPSPNSLIIVIGHTARQLSQAPGAVEVGAIQRTPANCYACQNAVGSGPVLQFILAGGAVALLLPVLILIATASRLSAARREERFAAMRLVGATPRQISVVSAVEAVVAAVAGVAVGFALFFVFRPLLYHVPFTGAPLAPGDLSLHGIDIVLVVIGVPVAAVVSARLALRRVQISPLGVTAASVVPPTADGTDHPAPCRHRRARVLRRRRQAGQQSAASFSSCSWASCSWWSGWSSPDRGSRPPVPDSWRSGPVGPPRSSPAAGSSTIPRRPSGSSAGW